MIDANDKWIDTRMTKKLVLAGCAAILLPALSGCASMGNATQKLWDWDIRGNAASNQPATSRVAPLVVPPDFALTPSQAGVGRPQDGSQDQGLDALFGGASPRSVSETAVIRAAGTSEAGIRSSVGDPETNTVNKGSVTRDIIAAPEGDGQTAQSAIPK
jgi:Protein of unknown function (DUF3035)